MKILLLSDFHAGSIQFNDNAKKFLKALNNDIDAKKSNIVLCLGDLVFKGRNYYYLLEYFFNDNFFNDKKIFFIPGNHDCSLESKFENFNYFIQNINNTHGNFKDSNCIVHNIDNISLLLINTSYQYNYKRGEIHIPTLLKEIEKIKNKNLIAVAHHHFFKTDNDNDSYVKNGEEVINILEEYNCKLLIHGHLHEKTIPYERKMNLKIEGVSSFSWSNSKKYLIDIITISDNNIKLNPKKLGGEYEK